MFTSSLPEGRGFLLAPCLSMKAFGGFLGRRPYVRRSISTSYQGKPCLFDVHGGNPIGVGGEPALEAGELRLPLRVVSRSVPAPGALAAGVHRRHRHEHAAPPPGLIFQLAS